MHVPHKRRIAGYVGVGLGGVSLLHTWYAAGVYDNQIRIGLPFFTDLGLVLSARYAYALDLVVAVVSFLLVSAALSMLPPLEELTLESLLEYGNVVLGLSIVLVFLPQVSGASWSKATLCGLVVLTGLLVLVSYAYPLPAWETAALYLSLVFGAFTIGRQWLDFASTVSSYSVRPMSYFVLSMTYVVVGSLWLLVGNLEGEPVEQVVGSDSAERVAGSDSVEQVADTRDGVPGGTARDETVLTALASPLVDALDSETEASETGPTERLSPAVDGSYGELDSADIGLPTGEDRIDPEAVPTLQDLLFSVHAPIRFDAPAMHVSTSVSPTATSALQLLCAETYRESVGEHPRTVAFRTVEDMLSETVGDFDGGTVCVLFPQTEWEQIRSDPTIGTRFWDRLYGIAADERSAVVTNATALEPPREYYLATQRFEWRSLSPDRIRRICRLCFGYLPAAPDRSGQSADVAGQSEANADSIPRSDGRDDTTPAEETVHLEQYRERLLRALRSHAHDRDGVYHDATAEHPTHESSRHLLLKRFVVRWLAEAESVGQSAPEIASRIRTNVPTAGHTADVRIDDDVFEIETGHVPDSATDSVRNQFQQAFIKYSEAEIRSVTVVVDPLTMARHLDAVVALCYNHERWSQQTGIAVRFTVPNLSTGELVPLAQFATDVAALQE